MKNNKEKKLQQDKNEKPWFLLIYVVGLIQAIIFGIFGNSIYASGNISYVASSIISYHAFACLMFGIMLIFNTEGLLHSSTGFTSIKGNNNDRVGLQLTQITGAWVIAYAMLSYMVLFFVKNPFVILLLLQIFAIFAQGSEVIIKLKSDKKFGIGPILNTHHIIIQIIGIIFLLSSYSIN